MDERFIDLPYPPSISGSFLWALTRIICRYIALLDYRSAKNDDIE